jgi:hypothetical protein
MIKKHKMDGLPPLTRGSDDEGDGDGDFEVAYEGGYQLVGQLRRENAALKAQLEAFERKFVELQGGAVASTEGADDIIMLNVGGKHFSSLRSTLCR